jgi:Replication initiator protein A
MSTRSYQDGRDEMNLADFPISALQRQQPSDGQGRKLDTLVYESSRYDPATHQRVRQRVTLLTTAHDGLPTPADEHVILALLYVAKHVTNFADAVVHFAPGQLFEIMGWAPNGRSYERLRGVLRRLKSLNLRYENAWWDAAGRGYEEEVATGIISGYRIARQVSGPRKPGAVGSSWVSWTQQFHESLQKGNLKRLNLEQFFKLSSPTAQRTYRFLDKRFYNSSTLSMDLVEFACGHVGLTENDNVAVLKRRLAPALKELEEIGFLAPAGDGARYQKIKPGVWRVHFQAAGEQTRRQGDNQTGRPESGGNPPAPAAASEMARPVGVVDELVLEFYRRWSPRAAILPGPRDAEQAQALVREHGEAVARALIPDLVQVLRKEWPDCRSLSGALQKYLPDAVKVYRQEQERKAGRRAAEAGRRQEQETLLQRQQEERRRNERWQTLPPEERDAIRRAVLGRLSGASAPEAFVHRLCLEEMARRDTTAAAMG